MQRLALFLRSEGDEAARVAVDRRGSRCRVAAGEQTDDLDAVRLPDGRLSLLFEDGRQVSGRGRARGQEDVEVVRGARAVSIPISKARRGRAGRLGDADRGGFEEVRALMHGRIVEVRVTAGDRVEAGALLLVLEAMKMQNEIRASLAGIIERAEVSSGQTVEGGAFLLSIRSENS